jgi:transposase InsO family protein
VLTVHARRLLVDRVRRQGWRSAVAAEALGCSRATAYKWLARYDAEGDAGLQDRSCRPRTSPTRLSAAREGAIVARRAATLEGPHRIGWALGEARSTVHRVLRRHGVPRLADIDRPTRTVVRYQRDSPGELVHVDVKKQGRIPDGGGWQALGRQAGRRNRNGVGFDYLHSAVDDHSRLAYIEAHPDERKDTAAGFLTRAIAWFADHGVTVQAVMTDNGSCYRSGLVADTLADRHVRHLRTRAYRPQTNGKVERLNLTLKHEWAYATVYTSNQARLDDLDRWQHHYNWHRPHMAHHGGTPMSAVNNLPANHT